MHPIAPCGLARDVLREGAERAYLGSIPRRPAPSPEQLSRGAENEILLDEVREYCGIHLAEAFRLAGAPAGALTDFLQSTWRCPGEVLEFCRKALAPASPERRAYAERLAHAKKAPA